MKKYKQAVLIILAMLLGLLTTSFLYYQTDSNRSVYSPTNGNSQYYGLCNAATLSFEPDQLAYGIDVQINGGTPFVSHTTVQLLGDCSSNASESQVIKAYVMTWQFYANLLVWSTAWFAALYIANRYVLKKK